MPVSLPSADGVEDAETTHGDLELTPVWADSLGAKSACCLVETPDLALCIDPGAAVMHGSFPAPDPVKRALDVEAHEAVVAAARHADHVAVSHYHWDHLVPDPSLYDETALWVKDPNRWINDSQSVRAREFLADVAATRGAELVETRPRQTGYADPFADLDHARSIDVGDYEARREELLAEWREGFRRRTENWASRPWIEQPPGVRFADGETLERGDTTVRFHGPLFHGIEYARTGWVNATLVETPDSTFVHTSDLQGPTVEDYADWLVAVDPDLLFLDGPATYLLGYLLNRVNLDRAVENAVRVIREADPALTIWDHHPLREAAHRDRTRPVWELRDEGYRIETVAGLRGEEPFVDRAARWSDEERDAATVAARRALDARDG